MSGVRLRLIDPKHIKLHERRRKAMVDTRIDEQGDIDLGSRQTLLVQQLLDQAFVFNRENIQNYMLDKIGQGQSINTRDLPIDSAHDLLALAHVIELGSINNLDSDLKFEISHNGQRDKFSNFYHRSDEFTISLIDKNHV